MNIPFFDLKRQYQLIQADVEKAVIDVMRSCGYVEGPAVKSFENNVRDFLSVKHVISNNSGTDSLELALKACGVEAGDEVITSAFSYFATAEAIGSVGAVPVFCDVKMQDYNIDPTKIEALITDKTKAILPVHIFGSPADMDAINAIAKKHGLKVVEDCAQAIGAKYNGKSCGTLGHIAGFSFYPTKNLGAFGDGGMMTTNDDALALIAGTLKAHAGGKNGMAAAKLLGKDVGQMEVEQEATDLYDPYKYYNYLIGENSRLDSVQAAVLDVKLAKLNDFNAKRAAIAAKYNERLADLPIQLPVQKDDKVEGCWHQYVLLCDKKDELIAFMGEQGVGTGAFYPVPLHLQKAFATLQYKEGDRPVAEEICSKSVCLPVFPELTEEETDYIIEKMHAFFN